MSTPYESRRRTRRLSDDQGISSGGRERETRSYGLVRRGTEPAARKSEENPPRYVAILLLGLSGVGKSTFISHLTHGALKIGHSLTSCTTDVDGYLFTRSDGQQVYLLDSPGFDDTEKDNNRILRTIAMMLKTMHDSGIFILAGVLYLHRISDVRMAGSAIKSMRLIEKICGQDNFRAITVATTMWELVEPEVAENREQSLISTPDYFGRLEAGGATIVRHLNTFASAVNIVEHILGKGHNAILDIQVEMAIERKSLDHTAAGQYLLGEFEQLHAKYERELEDLEEALEEAKDDDDLATMISEQRRENEENIRRVKLSQQELSVTPEQMEQEQQEWFAERVAEAESSTFEGVAKTQREIELEEQLERTEMDTIRQINQLRLQAKSTEKENQRLKKQIKERQRQEQAHRERMLRDREESRPDLIDYTHSFMNVLRRGLSFKISTLRRAATDSKMDLGWTRPRDPPLPKPTSESKPKAPRSRKTRQPKDFLGDQQDAEDEYDSSPVYAVEQQTALRAAQHAVAIHGQQTYGQPTHGQPMHGQPMHGQPMHGQPMHGQSMHGQPMHGQSMHGQPGASNPSQPHRLPRGFENPKTVKYAVDLSKSQAPIPLPRKYS